MRFLILFLFITSCHAFAAEMPRTDYEHVAASTTGTLGPVGGAGDILERLIISPSSLAIGTVAIQDGTLGMMTVVASTGTLNSLAPIVVPVGARSRNGAWKVVTPANATAIGVGRFQ